MIMRWLRWLRSSPSRPLPSVEIKDARFWGPFPDPRLDPPVPSLYPSTAPAPRCCQQSSGAEWYGTMGTGVHGGGGGLADV